MAELLVSWPLLVGIFFLAICGAFQMAWDRIPNPLTLVALMGGLVVSLCTQSGMIPGDGGIASSFVAGFVGFIALVGFYAKGYLGAGCVKCQAVFGVWLGCAFTTGTAAWLMLIGTGIAIAVTFAACVIWFKFDETEKLFPAQVTISLASIATVLVAIAAGT